MNEQAALQLVTDSGALLEGHFLLSSGRHSPNYLQCALVLRNPDYAGQVGQGIAEKWADTPVDVVVGPAMGGIIVAFAVAVAMGKPNIFAERQDGEMTFRRGFSLDAGQNVLIVEDVVTTGGSALEVARLVEASGANMVGFASIIDRTGGRELPYELRSLLKVDFPTYSPEECPLCASGSKPVKPGSRSF